MSDNLEISAEGLVHFAYIHHSETAHRGHDWVTIECNYCTRDRFVIFDGSESELPRSDWLRKLAVHAIKTHPGHYRLSL